MENCIFCKIAAGEMASATLYEDDEFRVILDRFPSSVGHTLILPKTHVATIFEIDPACAGRLFTLATKVAAALKETLPLAGMNLLQNNGEAAGQTVHHFHLHLIPRYENDAVKIQWLSQEPSDEDIETMRQAIAAHL